MVTSHSLSHYFCRFSYFIVVWLLTMYCCVCTICIYMGHGQHACLDYICGCNMLFMLTLPLVRMATSYFTYPCSLTFIRSISLLIHCGYCMAQNFGGKNLWWIAANKNFGGQNIGGLAALHCKIARIKIAGG